LAEMQILSLQHLSKVHCVKREGSYNRKKSYEAFTRSQSQFFRDQPKKQLMKTFAAKFVIKFKTSQILYWLICSDF